MIALKRGRRLPIPSITRNQRVKLQVEKEYYESKINCLIDMDLPLQLVLLACWDAPVSRDNLFSKRGRRRFIKRCLKYYKTKLKEIAREEKRLRS